MFPDAPEPGKREHLTFVNDKLCWRILFFSPENRSLMYFFKHILADIGLLTVIP